MTNAQLGKVNMLTRVELFFGKYKDRLKSFKPLKDRMDLFQTKKSAMQEDIDQQDLGNEAVAQIKEQKWAFMLKKLLPISDKGYDWAVEVNNLALMELFDVDEKDFKGDSILAATHAENILDAIVINLAALKDYNINQAVVDVAITAVVDYRAAIGTPQQQIAVLKIANKSIDDYIRFLKNLLKRCDKLIRAEYSETDAEMVKEYKEARKIGGAPVHHTTVIAHVYGDKAQTIPVAGATISIDILNRHEETDEEGMAEIVQFRPGSYQLTVKAPYYPDTIMPFTIKQGKHVELDIILKATGVEGIATQNNKPTAGLHVRIVGTAFTTITDANGHYSFIGLPAGTYVIEVANEGGDTASATVVVVNGVMEVVDLAL